MKTISKANAGVQPTYLNLKARQYHMALSAANGPLYLVFNEPEDTDMPFHWPDGILLTKEAYNAFKRAADALSLATHAASPIEPSIAAMGRWRVLTATCIRDVLSAAKGTQ